MSYFDLNIAKEAEKTVKLIFDTLVKPGDEENGFLPSGGGLHMIIGDNEGQVVHRFNILDPSAWPGEYKEHAESKFALTVKHQKPTREIMSLFPELAEGKDNTFYYGSEIDGGIIVACSGVDPEWDEALCKIAIAVIRAMVTKKVTIEKSAGNHFRK
jgi:hypothetical protein